MVELLVAMGYDGSQRDVAYAASIQSTIVLVNGEQAAPALSSLFPPYLAHPPHLP